MTNSLHSFLNGLIDYAGLFPPARLSMPMAVKTYARHLGANHAWMVGRFICPLNRLNEFGEEGQAVLRAHLPIKVAGLASPMSGTDAMLVIAAEDASMAMRFEEEGWAIVDVLEVRLPDDLKDLRAVQIRAALDRYEAALDKSGMRPDRIYYEISRTASWDDNVEQCVSALSGASHRGFKIRCGGITPDAYPSPLEVATAIRNCAKAGVPFKATAGLHHPTRHFRPSEQVFQHGFVNVFGAGILARNLTRETPLLAEIIDERNLDAFEFSDGALRWNGHSESISDILSAREALATSYGSCNIDEPVEDLTKSGLL